MQVDLGHALAKLSLSSDAKRAYIRDRLADCVSNDVRVALGSHVKKLWKDLWKACWQVSGVLLVGSLHISTATAEKPNTWFQLQRGLELSEIVISRGLFFNTTLTVVRASPAYFRPTVLRATDFGSKQMRSSDLGPRSKAAVLINANFFDETGTALGLLVSRGLVLQNMHQGGKTLTGVFHASSSGSGITGRGQFSLRGILEAVQAGPRLLINGATVAPLLSTRGSARRTGICIDSKRRILFFTAYSPMQGATFSELIMALRDPHIGCIDALNLDGGGSTQMYVAATETFSKPLVIDGEDPVPVMLALFPK